MSSLDILERVKTNLDGFGQQLATHPHNVSSLVKSFDRLQKHILKQLNGLQLLVDASQWSINCKDTEAALQEMKCLVYEIQVERLKEQLVQLRSDNHFTSDSSGSNANIIITTSDSTVSEGSSEVDHSQQQMHQEWHFAVAAEMDSATAAAANINRLVDHCFAIADQLSDTSANSSDIAIESQDTAFASGPETFDSAGDGSNADTTTSSANPPSPPLAEMPAAKLPRTALSWPRAKPANQPSKTARRNRASLVDSSVLMGTPAVVTSSTVEAPGETNITLAPAAAVDLQSPNVDNSSAVRPLTPIPPPPPLTTVATLSKQHERSRRPGERQREEKVITMSAAMPSPTQHRTLPPTSRAHPHPNRRRSKGKGAAARRKEKRRVANATAMSPGVSATLRSEAQTFVPCPLPPPHIPTITHVVHWVQHVGFPWSPCWDKMNWSPPSF